MIENGAPNYWRNNMPRTFPVGTEVPVFEMATRQVIETLSCYTHFHPDSLVSMMNIIFRVRHLDSSVDLTVIPVGAPRGGLK